MTIPSPTISPLLYTTLSAGLETSVPFIVATTKYSSGAGIAAVKLPWIVVAVTVLKTRAVGEAEGVAQGNPEAVTFKLFSAINGREPVEPPAEL